MASEAASIKLGVKPLIRIDYHCARRFPIGAGMFALFLTGCGFCPNTAGLESWPDSKSSVARVAIEPVSTNREISQQFFIAVKDGQLGWPLPGGVLAQNAQILALNTTREASIPRVIEVPDDLSKADLYNLKAEEFYNAGEREQAISIWEVNIQRSADHWPSQFNLAKAYLNANRFRDAAERFETLIRNDSIDKAYIQARFLGPWAYYKQNGRLLPRHGRYLYDYLNSADTVYRNHAEELFRIAKDPVVSEAVNHRLVEQMKADLVHSKRNIVHFWAEWCRPCLKELTDLFRFRSDFPDIHLWVVSVDAKDDKERADRRLNALFSPFKAGRNVNIRFLHDPEKQLWQRFIPYNDQPAGTVPKTVILNGSQTVGYIPLQADWIHLDPGRYWGNTIEPDGRHLVAPATTPPN